MDKPAPPPISKPLLDWLQFLFPDRCPNTAMSAREVWIAVGAASVVRKVEAVHQEQHKQSLTRIL